MANTKVTGDVIANGTISTVHLADDAITAAKLDSTATGITFADLTVNNNVTFTGNITFGDSHFIGDDADDNLLIQSSANENIIINSVDDLLLRTGGTTKLIVKNGGNVGIGTTSPTSYYSGANNLVIEQDSGEGGMSIVTANDTSGAIYFADGISGNEQYRGGIGYTHSTDKLFLVSGGQTIVWMNESGKVGIGTDLPNEKLTVNGNIESLDTFILRNSGGHRYQQLFQNTNDFVIRYNNTSDWLERMRIDSSGNVGIGSDAPTHLLTLEKTDTNSVQLVIDNFNTSDAGTETSTIRFRHYRSYVAGLNDAGEITLGKEEAWDAAGDRNSYMSFGTRTGASGVTEKMRITSSAEGHVELSGTAPVIKATASNGGSGLRINITGQTSGQLFRVQEDNATKFQINENGNVGIAETNPNGKLDIKQDMTAGTTAAFTNPHLRLSANNTVDSTGFVGMTFATSTANNYGFSWGALRTTNALGGMHLRYHASSASGTDIFNIDYVGNVTIATQKYIRSGSSAGWLTIQGGASYPGGRIDMYGGSNGAAGIEFLTGGTTATPTLRFRIDDSGDAYFINGNVGIGTTLPKANLDVNDDLRVNRYHKNVFNYFTVQSASNQYFHIKTGVGTNQTCMHMYHVEGYAYGTNDIIDERFGFHTDSGGSVYGKSYKGTYANNIYKSSDNKVVLVFGPLNTYYMSFMVHLIESGMYSELFVKPTAATYSSSNSGAY